MNGHAVTRKFVLGAKTRKYRGEEYTEFTGKIKNPDGTALLITVTTNKNDGAITYTAKDGTPLIYGRVTKVKGGRNGGGSI